LSSGISASTGRARRWPEPGNLDGGDPRRRQVDQDDAPVIGLALASHETVLRERLDGLRHGRLREPLELRQLGVRRGP
jgi:hypothetical protein